ncbi:hypothetical protein B0H10DRAFT_1093789 [Mycena sp. CBHHK59/15]|nr:hypothetical protein B0H10DRAFT_1093789 [Mycena sp. CBHHK59/15]
MLTPLLLVLQCPALCNTWTMDSRTFYLYIVVLVECIAFLESIRVPSCLRGDSLHRPCVVSILGCELSSRPTYIPRTTCRSWIPVSRPLVPSHCPAGAASTHCYAARELVAAGTC